MFKKLQNQHYYQIPEHFHHPNKDISLPLAATSHSPAPLQGNHSLTFCVCDFTTLDILYKWNETIFGLLCLAFFLERKNNE